MLSSHYDLNKLNPLANNSEGNYLSQEQKNIIHAVAARASQPRKPKTVDYLTLPSIAFTELEVLYHKKYKGTNGNHSFRLNLYRLLLSIIYTRHQKELVSQKDFVSLSSEILRNLLGKNKAKTDYSTIIQDLVDWKLIEINGSYRVKSATNKGYSKGYRLTEKVLADTWKSERIYGVKYWEKTEKLLGKRTAELVLDESQPQYRWLKNNLLKLSIQPEALDWITEQEKNKIKLPDKEVRREGKYVKLTNRVFNEEVANSYRFTVEEINFRKQDSNPYFQIYNTNNRLGNGLANLPGKLRKFVKVDGVEKDLKYIDLSSSQVYLLLPLLQKTLAVRSSDYKEYKKFSDLVLAGNFYEDLKNLIEPEFKVEGGDKTNFLKFVLFSNTHKPYGYRKAFNKIFPTINNAILELVSNAKDKEEGLAVQLQKMEASLFLDSICPAILSELGEINIFTLHDGLICEEKDFDEVYNIMLDVLKKETGNTPHLKEDNFQNPESKEETKPAHKKKLKFPNFLKEVSAAEISKLFQLAEQSETEKQKEISQIFQRLEGEAMLATVEEEELPW